MSDNDDEVSNTSDVDDLQRVSPQSEIFSRQQNDLPFVGDRVKIFWPIDNAYYKVSVSELMIDGKHVIVYEDEDVDTLIMCEVNYRYESSTHAELGNFTKLPSDRQRFLLEIISVVGNQSFF